MCLANIMRQCFVVFLLLEGNYDNKEYVVQPKKIKCSRSMKDVSKFILNNNYTINTNKKDEYVPNSPKSMLSNEISHNSFMLNFLKKQNEEEKRRIEVERRNWATAGFAKFGEILRQNNDDISEFAYNVILHLVSYTHCNQGGLFIINDDDKHHQHLQLLNLVRRLCQILIPKRIITLKIQVTEVRLTIIMATYIKTSMVDLTQVGEVLGLA